MGKVTKRDSDSLNQLVLDCSIYNFSEKEALKYIQARFGKGVSGRTYRRYKKNLESGNIAHEWINYFTRTGIVVQYQQMVSTAQHLLESSMRRLLQEENKEIQDDNFMLRLKEDIRHDLKIIDELCDDGPIVSSVIEKIHKLEKRLKQKEEELLQRGGLTNNRLLPV